MRYLIPYALLLLLKGVSNLFWPKRVEWVGEIGPGDRWSDIRVVAILNHTSLYEWVFAGVCPNRFLRQIARHGVVPIAEKTSKRPVVGVFYRTVAAHVVPISRQRDHTWRTVVEKVDDPKAMLIIAPEGRMMRRNGLDHEGKPMTMRGGIADILSLVPDGKMLLAYSGGLHHVQAPGEHVPRLFRTVRMNFERVDVAAYRAAHLAGGEAGFRNRVKADLEARRDRYCPATPETAPGLGRRSA
jgi:1-acyl-sn-glycerol-3-phosphate acyltransferase